MITDIALNQVDDPKVKQLWKLQDKLNHMPLIPLSPRVRNQRVKTMRELMELARKLNRVSEVNMGAGVI